MNTNLSTFSPGIDCLNKSPSLNDRKEKIINRLTISICKLIIFLFLSIDSLNVIYSRNRSRAFLYSIISFAVLKHICPICNGFTFSK